MIFEALGRPVGDWAAGVGAVAIVAILAWSLRDGSAERRRLAVALGAARMRVEVAALLERHAKYYRARDKTVQMDVCEDLLQSVRHIDPERLAATPIGVRSE